MTRWLKFSLYLVKKVVKMLSEKKLENEFISFDSTFDNFPFCKLVLLIFSGFKNLLMFLSSKKSECSRSDRNEQWSENLTAFEPVNM